MNKFIITANEYLKQNIQAFYHTDYVGYEKPDNPDYINVLKNTYGKCPINELNSAVIQLKRVLMKDLSHILSSKSKPLMICVVPRAKSFASYSPNQLLFNSTIQDVIKNHHSSLMVLRILSDIPTHIPHTCLQIQRIILMMGLSHM